MSKAGVTGRQGRAWVLYARVSEDKEGREVSVSEQLDRMRAVAAERQYSPSGKEYVDNDVSASRFATKPRPQFEAMVRDVADGHVAGVVVWAVDRLARDWRAFGRLLAEAKRLGLTLYAVEDERAWSLTNGNDLYDLERKVLDAKGESQRTSNRVRRSRAARRAKALPTLGAVYGWRSATEPEPGEAAEVRRMVKRFLAGESLTEVARDLNARHVVRRKSTRNWDHSIVRSVITAPRHYGLIHLCEYWGEGVDKAEVERPVRHDVLREGRQIPASAPGFLDPALFDQVRGRLTLGSLGGSTRGAAALLTGIVHCGRCGHPLFYTYRPGGARWLHCVRDTVRSAPTGNGHRCGGISIRVEIAEDWVRDLVLARLADVDLASYAGAGDAQAAELDVRIGELSARGRELADGYAAGGLGLDAYMNATEAIKRDLDELAVRRARLARRPAVLARFAGARDVSKAWDRLPVGAQREVIAELLLGAGARIILDPRTHGVAERPRWPYSDAIFAAERARLRLAAS